MKVSVEVFRTIVGDGSHKKEHRTKPKKKAGANVELREQIKIFTWRNAAILKWPEAEFIFAVPNCIASNAKSGAIQKSAGLTKGAPDIVVPIVRPDCPGLYIEMKTAEGELSPEQKHSRDHLIDQGYAWKLSAVPGKR